MQTPGWVRTTNLGGLYELQYPVKLIEAEKKLLDAVRQRGGNRNLTGGRYMTTAIAPGITGITAGLVQRRKKVHAA